MDSFVCGSRRRLVSATYDGVGARWKEQLSDVSLAVYDECPQTEDIARKLAMLKRVDSGSFFVMDASRVESSMEEWNRHMSNCAPFYPINCNDDPLLLQLLTRNNDCNLHVSSLPELEIALSLVSPSRIVFHSHLLTRKMLRIIATLEEPLHAVVVDNEESAVDSYSLNPFQPLLLRVSLSPDSERVDLAIGMPVEEAMECVPRLIRSGVPLMGLSVQLMADGEDMMERGSTLIHLMAMLYPCGLSALDVGDGFDSSSLYETAYFLECILESAKATHVKLMATPGRFLAASAFTLVTSIVGKRSIDARVLTRREEDWGREGFVYETTHSVYGVFSNRMMGEKPRCQPLAMEENGVREEEHESAVLGSTRDPIDFPQRHARLPSLAVGDCLLWKEMGAYAARDEDGLPVYYYTGRDHWERLKGRSEEREMMSDGGSEGDTDGESIGDDDDMTECFGRVFN